MQYVVLTAQVRSSQKLFMMLKLLKQLLYYFVLLVDVLPDFENLFKHICFVLILPLLRCTGNSVCSDFSYCMYIVFIFPQFSPAFHCTHVHCFYAILKDKLCISILIFSDFMRFR